MGDRHLPAEPIERARIPHHRGVRHLEDHQATGGVVPGLVRLGERALAQPADDLEPVDGLAGREPHLSPSEGNGTSGSCAGRSGRGAATSPGRPER